MIIHPNDAMPYDMEPEDFHDYLVRKPFSQWTKNEVDWSNWWMRGRPSERQRRTEAIQELYKKIADESILSRFTV